MQKRTYRGSAPRETAIGTVPESDHSPAKRQQTCEAAQTAACGSSYCAGCYQIGPRRWIHPPKCGKDWVQRRKSKPTLQANGLGHRRFERCQVWKSVEMLNPSSEKLQLFTQLYIEQGFNAFKACTAMGMKPGTARAGQSLTPSVAA